MRESRPRKAPGVIRRAIGLAGVSLIGAALLTWTPQPATGWNQSAAEATLWQLMNGARVNNGRRAVQQHGTLVSLARWRSRDQVQRSYFSHTVLGTGYEVYHWYDSNGLSYSWGGENIGWNSGASDGDSPVLIHEGFMNSPGHRANVLEPAFTHGGVGAYGADGVSFLGKKRDPRFYTELFMVSSSTPPPPPPGNPNPPPPPPSGGNAAPVARAKPDRPKQRELRVDRPQTPESPERFDGPTLVASADPTGAPDAALALARTRPLDELAGAGSATAPGPGSMRVEAASADGGGLVETVVGSLLGFFL